MAKMLAAFDSPKLLCLLLLVHMMGDGVLAGLNATWIAPTPGCSSSALYADCIRDQVCAPSFLVFSMGETVRFTLAATNPTRGFLAESVQHCNNAGTRTTCSPVYVQRLTGGPPDPSNTCCNFNPLLGDSGTYGSLNQGPVTSSLSTASFSDSTSFTSPFTNISIIDVFPSNHNVTRVDFIWRTPSPDAVTGSQVPLFNLTFSAAYGRLNNVSACTKVIFIRLCLVPTFVQAGSNFSDTSSVGDVRQYSHVLSAPAFYPSPTNVTLRASPPNSACGVAAGLACLSPAVFIAGKGHVSTLTLSSPSFEGVKRWAWEDTLVDNRFGDNWPLIGVRVGQSVSFTLQTRTLNGPEALSLFLIEDPGLPIGMSLGAQFMCTPGNTSYCWNVSWTPRKGQEGRIHEARFLSRGPDTSSVPGACVGRASRSFSVRIPVTTPKSVWVGPEIPEGTGVVGTKFMQPLQCRSNYKPQVLPTAETDMTGAALELARWTDEGVMAEGRSLADYTFSYTPVRGDEGTVKTWCFTCGDDQGVTDRTTSAATRCVRVRTRLCSYTVSQGETLQTVTRKYQLTTNWLNVWNANPVIQDPDLALDEGTVVKLGPTYTVRAGDTLASIAAEFSTTVKKLLAVNPAVEMSPGEEMQPGTSICVLACTNIPSPSMNYKWAY